MRKLFLVLLAIGLLAAPTFAGTGNLAPSGAHYNLNIHGVSGDGKTAPMTNTDGHSIFVPLNGKATIWLKPGDDFQVLDANGTDQNGAAFQLPNPDPNNTGTTYYSVYARYLGKPNLTPTMMQTCATDPQITNPNTGLPEVVCSMSVLPMDNTKRPQKFDNVTKYLLYIYYDIDSDGTVERVPLFSSELSDYFWGYDNYGLKLAQLRFYWIPTTVPDP
jgi:hypothetical protein